MKLEEVFNNKANFDKYVQFCSKQTSFSSGASKVQSSRYSIKRLKMEQGNGFLVVPMMIHLPLAVNGSISQTDVPYLGSYRTAIALIKALCNSNATYAENLKAILGEGFEKLNLADSDVTDEEAAVFKRYRKPLVYARSVMTVKALDSKYQFGTPYRVNIATDPETGEYVDDVKNPLIYKLHRLETSCIATMVKQLREENEARGDGRRTEADLNDQIKNLWDGRCISNPYNLGTTRVLFFKATKNFDADSSVTDKWKAELSTLKNYEYYIKINRSILENLEGCIGTKYDRYEDFLLIKQITPDFDEKTRGTAAQKISRTAAGSDEKLETMLDGFSTTYKEYRDNLDDWDENIILKCAFEYRTISDSAISDIFKNYMPMLSSAMKTAEIAEKYQEVIQMVDTTLSDSLLESAMLGELQEAGDTSKEISEAPIVSEDTPGYGGDTPDGASLSEEFAKALAEE